MRRSFFVGLCVSVCFVAAAAPGCGGSSEGGTTAQPVPLEQFSERAATAYCASIKSCCDKAQYTYDAAACTTAFGQFLDQSLVKPVAGGKTSYDAAAAGTCLSQLESRACDSVEPEPAACEKVFVGTVPAGGACESDTECAPPPGGEADCDMVDGASSGTCVQTPRGKAGDACDTTCSQSGSTSYCSSSGSGSGSGSATCWTNDGLYCDGAKCAAVIPIGGACEYEGCVDGAYCATGKCAAKSAAGGSCDGGWDSCATGSYCESTSKTCKPQKKAGEPCADVDDECQGYCNEGVCEGGGADVSPGLCAGTLK
jgi:hypothetical protein